MRKFPVLLLIPTLAAMYAGCKSFSTRHLVPEKAAGAKTALVIDTDFFSTHDTPKNGFNLKCENMSKEECNEVMTRLKAAEEGQRSKLMAYLAGLTRTMLTAKGMPYIGLDRKVYFDSKQFPLSYPGDRYTYCAVSRDFRELLKKGYTHVMYAGFPNRIIYKKGAVPAMFFGIESFMVDLRPEVGDMESRDNRVERMIWCYKISPSQRSSTSSYSWHTYNYTKYGTQTTRHTQTTTTYYRNCLGIALVRRNGTPYTLDEIFAGPPPLYIDIYKRAALYGLGFSGQHLAGKDIPGEKVKTGVGVDDFIAGIKLP